jgi:hypothetical protein
LKPPFAQLIELAPFAHSTYPGVGLMEGLGSSKLIQQAHSFSGLFTFSEPVKLKNKWSRCILKKMKLLMIIDLLLAD